MDELPSLQTNQRRVDVEHLKLLATFHFVGLGLAVIGLVGIAGHYAMFDTIMSNPKLWQQQGAAPPPVEMFAPMKWMYLVMGVGIAGTGVLNLLSAFWLRARQHRTFSIVVAVLNCLYMPLGTALGIFTIVVLVRRSVAELYEARPGMPRE